MKKKADNDELVTKGYLNQVLDRDFKAVFDHVDIVRDELVTRMDRMHDELVTRMDKKHNEIMNKLDAFLKRMTTNEEDILITSYRSRELEKRVDAHEKQLKRLKHAA